MHQDQHQEAYDSQDTQLLLLLHQLLSLCLNSCQLLVATLSLQFSCNERLLADTLLFVIGSGFLREDELSDPLFVLSLLFLQTTKLALFGDRGVVVPF